MTGARPQSSIQAAFSQFVNPDVGQSKVANATALGTKIKSSTPPPDKTTITVLNGNGVPGAAASASYLLGQRGYPLILPPAGPQPNAPLQNYFHTQIYFNRAVAGSAKAAGRRSRSCSRRPTSARCRRGARCARSTRARCSSSSSARRSTMR